MDAPRFITDCLTQVHIRLQGTCEGLTSEQLVWRPTPVSNNIGFILWHLVRNEDARVTSSDGPPELWVADEWHRKFGHPVSAPDPGDRMGLQSLAIPTLDVLLGYAEVVHERTIAFVSTLTAEKLDGPMPTEPRQTVAGSLRHMITHKNHHHGQIDYLRGLQEESWDLPRGTGGILPI